MGLLKDQRLGGYAEVEHHQLNTTHRALLKKVNDDGDQQLVDYTGVHGEEHTEVLRLQNYGYTSVPPADSEGVIHGLASRDMPVVIGMEHPPSKPKGLKPGQTMVYDQKGTKVFLDNEGNLTVEANEIVTIKKAKEVKIETADAVSIKTPTVNIEATTLNVKGDIKHQGNITSTGVHKAQAHV